MFDSNSITITVSPATGDGTYKRCIYKAAATGDWTKASLYNKMNPNWTNTPLTMDKDTALHIAVKMEKIKFVTKLVQHISKKEMEIRTADGNTAFCLAAISGNVKIAKILCEKNPDLVWIKGFEEKLPIELAFLAAQFHMVKFLFERIEDNMHNNNNNNYINLPFKDIIKLFFLTLSSHNYGGAWSLLVKIPELGRTENENGLTALQLLAQSSFEKKTPCYKDLISLLFDGIEEEEDKFLQYKKTSKIMFDAAQIGNTLILEYIFTYDPNMFMEVNNEGQSILHIAILNRQESVYDLILSKGSYKNVLVQLVDRGGNNVLHLAGKLIASKGILGSPQLHQDFICKEEKWFKEVEKIIPPILKTKKNKDDMIPEEVFYREHKGSSEKAVIEVNKTADTFLVVISFIMTTGITGALSIQNNKISENPHFLSYKKWFKVLILSIGCGVSLCATSMFLQNSIVLPSTWTKKHGYVTSRLSRMTLGYLSLYSAFPNIFMLSIFSGAVLIFSFFPTWVFYAIDVFNAIPFVLYIILFCYPLSIYVGSKLASYQKVLQHLCQSR